MRLVETAAQEIDDEALEAALRPGEMLLARWEILVQAGDERAGDALRAGVDFIETFAARIDDPELRTGFLTGIPAHVTLGAAGLDEAHG